MNSMPLLRRSPWALLLLLAACGDEESPVISPDTGLEDNEDVEDRRDTGRPLPPPEDTSPVPDTGPAPDTTPVTPPDTSTGTCGDGRRDLGEACDGTDLGTASCSLLNFVGGELRCTPTCTFDTSQCYQELCGDGIVSGNEDCDGTLAETITCDSLGFAPRVPDANVVCQPAESDFACRFDTSRCVRQFCGNDNVEIGEACDGSNFNRTSCRTLGLFAGDLVCAEDCQTVDRSGCVTNICGNGTVEGPEVCDSRLFDVTCRDLAVPEDRLDELDEVCEPVTCPEPDPCEPVTCPEPCDPEDAECIDEVCEPVECPTPEPCTPVTCDAGDPVFFAGGLLTCGEGCTSYDTSGCIVSRTELEDAGDRDDDGIPDASDNCPDVANPRQLDVDNNGVGNVCDEPMIFNMLVPEDGINAVTVTGQANVFITDINVPITVPVTAGAVTASFDDNGGARMLNLVVTFGATTLEIDIGGGGGGLPFPIPLPGVGEPVEVEVTGGSLVSGTGAAGESTLTQATFTQYFAGRIDSAHSDFTARLQILTASGNSNPRDASLSGTRSVVDLPFRTWRIRFNDTTANLGTLSIDAGGGGGLPFPIPLPGLGGIEANLIGLQGTVLLQAE
jgi:hypothetical protein